MLRHALKPATLWSLSSVHCGLCNSWRFAFIRECRDSSIVPAVSDDMHACRRAGASGSAAAHGCERERCAQSSRAYTRWSRHQDQGTISVMLWHRLMKESMLAPLRSRMMRSEWRRLYVLEQHQLQGSFLDTYMLNHQMQLLPLLQYLLLMLSGTVASKNSAFTAVLNRTI